MGAQYEICPKCSAHFEGRSALLWGGVAAYSGFTLPAASSKVCCPRCGYVFAGRNVRFFGFLSAPALCLALLVGVMAAVLVIVMASEAPSGVGLQGRTFGEVGMPAFDPART